MVREHLPAPGTELGAYTFLDPDADDEEGFRLCEEAGQELRRQAEEADPSAVKDEEGF